MIGNFFNALKMLFIWQICNVLFFLSILILIVILGVAVGPTVDPSNSQHSVISEGSSSSKGYILQIPMEGIIMKNDKESIFDETIGPYERIVADLKAAEEDDNVQAVLFVVNSPGGSVSVCDRLYQIIKDFKEKTKIPVYAFYESVAASGGVYTTVASNYIMAAPTCVTGSVGVIMGGINVLELMDKIGVKEQTYKSGALKDMGSGSRKSTEEETLLIQGIVDELFTRFVDIVVEGRKEKVKRDDIINLKGAFFLPQRALENGLIDEIGSYELIVKKIRDDLDQNLNVINYAQKTEWERMFNVFGTLVPKNMRQRLELQGPLYLFEI
jgi:protease IV